MAAFKFNFFPEEDDTGDKKLAATAPKNESATALASADSNPDKCLSAACSLPVEQVRAELDLGRSKYRVVDIDGVQLMVAQPKLDSASSVGRIVTTRDVLKGVYEGGLKVWECSLDLVRFLASNPSIIGKSGLVSSAKSSADPARHLDSLPVINVLELGCGHGLPGIFTLKKFPNCKVCFQDLNEEVLQHTTASNVVYNAGREATDARACFVRGDWTSASFVPKLFKIARCRSFDVVLAAETLYTKSSSVIMSQLLWQLLTPKTGVGLVASKKYYFGEGLEGGTDTFKYHIETNWRQKLQARTVMKVEDKASNIREIIKVIRQV